MGKGQDKAAEVDVEGYRALVADAVGLAVVQLVGEATESPRVMMARSVAAYFLRERDHLVFPDIAIVMDKPERWVRYQVDYIKRRMDRYHAFRIYIEQEMASYAVASS